MELIEMKSNIPGIKCYFPKENISCATVVATKKVFNLPDTVTYKTVSTTKSKIAFDFLGLFNSTTETKVPIVEKQIIHKPKCEVTDEMKLVEDIVKNTLTNMNSKKFIKFSRTIIGKNSDDLNTGDVIHANLKIHEMDNKFIVNWVS